MSAPERRTVTLKTPLKRGDDDVTEIHLREPRAGELRGLENFSILRMDVSAHRVLVPRLCDMTANEFDSLSPKDLLAIQQEVVAFFTE